MAIVAAARGAFSPATTHAALAGAAFLAVGLLTTGSLRSRREARRL